jgi:beta-fructofuranosidase
MNAPHTSDLHRPRSHFTAARHWINDPNGVGFHAGRWHLYYQHNPGAAHWGDMHWGHATSADLVTWRDEPIALAPTPGTGDAGGCFSGSLVVVERVPTLYYTGWTPERQVQCMATATDDTLNVWRKHPAPILPEPPEGVSPQDFRDPWVFRHGDGWCMVLGASWRGERGQCLLYRSADGQVWTYHGPLFTSPNLALGRMWECPNLFPVGDPALGLWALTVSVWPSLGAHAFIGRFDGERFTPESDTVLDVDGGSFAHLATVAPDGRVLQWAWLNEQRAQHRTDAGGWAGAMSVPREIGLDAQRRLTIRPAAEMAHLRTALVEPGADGVRQGRHLDIEAEFALRDDQPVGLILAASPDGGDRTRVVYRPQARQLTIERSRSSLDAEVSRQDVQGLLVLDDGEPLRLRVLLDASVLEVYANERLCLSTRLYPTRGDSDRVSAFCDGGASTVVRLQAWATGEAMPGRSA